MFTEYRKSTNWNNVPITYILRKTFLDVVCSFVEVLEDNGNVHVDYH